MAQERVAPREGFRPPAAERVEKDEALTPAVDLEEKFAARIAEVEARYVQELATLRAEQLERATLLEKQLAGQLEAKLLALARPTAGVPFFSIADAEPGIRGYDITEALEWSLKHKSRDHIIVIPPSETRGARHRWQITRQVEIPRQHGGWIWFVGEGSNNHYTGLHCSIEWGGPAHDLEAERKQRLEDPEFIPGSMWLYRSTDWRFSGSPKFYGAGKCGIGLLTTKSGSYNAGRMDWEGASWYDFADAGVQLGRHVWEVSNECNFWGCQGFHDCPVGFRVVGHQALLQSFESLYSGGDVGAACQYYASGCLWVDECYLNGLLLELNSAERWTPGAGNKSTGKNNGVFYFGRLKSDTQAKAPQLIRCNDSIRADVVFDTGVISGGDTKTGPMIQIKDNCFVTCRNLRMLGGGGTIEGEGGTVLLDACRRVSRVGTFRDDVRGQVELRMRDCVNYSGEPMELSIAP